jgi:SAM-dependent methyltransferase
MFFLVSVGFQPQEVADYERKRYRGLDQRLVNAREIRILGRFLSVCSSSVEEDARPGTGGPVRALDAPCGYGRFARLLGEAGCAVFAADLSVAMVRRARAQGTAPSFPIGIVSNLTRGLPFKSGSFSLVFSMRFFHHLHDSPARRAALGEFARVTRDWLIISYYQANPLHLVQRALRRKILGKKTRIKMISGREFREEARSAGLDVVRIAPLFRGIHAQHIALLRKRGASGASRK